MQKDEALSKGCGGVRHQGRELCRGGGASQEWPEEGCGQVVR